MTDVTPVTPVPEPGDWRLEVWRTFLRAHAVVIREMERDLDEAGLPLGWYDVLLNLAEAPDRRLRMAQLADRVLLSRSGLTRLIDRLEKAGLVRREPATQDARGTYTVLLPAGIHRLREAVPTHLRGIQRYWLCHFEDEDLRVLGDLLGRVAGPS